MSIIDLYLDFICVTVCMRYATIARMEGMTELENEFTLLYTLQQIFLQVALIPRYFMFIWTLSGFGRFIPCRKIILENVFECEELETRHR